MPIKGFKSIAEQTKVSVIQMYGTPSKYKVYDKLVIDEYKSIPYLCDKTNVEFEVKWYALRNGLDRPHYAPLELVYPEKIEFIKENYPKYGLEYCVQNTGLKFHTVRHLIAKFNIKKYKEQLPKNHLRCAYCNKVLPTSQFIKRKNIKRGYVSYCYDCFSIKSKKRRKNTKLNNNARRMCALRECLSSTKQRAREKNLPHDLDLEWLDKNTPDFCPVLGIRLEFLSDEKTKNNSASADRVDNDDGYLQTNTIMVSKKVNSVKRDANIDELVKIAKFYDNLRNEKLDYQI